MRNRTWKRLTLMTLLVGSFLVGGCGPAVQPLPSTLSLNRTPVTGAWSTMKAAVSKGLQESTYQIKSNVSVAGSSLHTDYSLYGKINLPNTASLSLHENNFNPVFYQQGLVAYAYENNQWVKADPLVNMDVYASYQRLLKSIPASTAIYQLKKAYVVDEYCNVYQADVSANDVASIALWDNQAQLPNMGTVRITFYVGQVDGQLREVKTDSVGNVKRMGSVEVVSDTVLFNYNKPSAAVQLPLSLVKLLKGETKQ